MGKTASRGVGAKRCVIKADGLWRAGGDGICEGTVFAVEGQRWRVRLQRPLSITSQSTCVSLLLAAAGGNQGCSRCRLRLVNHIDPQQALVVEASRDFGEGGVTSSGCAMGSHAAIEVELLRKPSSGFIRTQAPDPRPGRQLGLLED